MLVQNLPRQNPIESVHLLLLIDSFPIKKKIEIFLRYAFDGESRFFIRQCWKKRLPVCCGLDQTEP